MIDKRKRTFLLASISATSLPLLASVNVGKSLSAPDASERVDQLIYVYKLWKQKKIIEPDAYLKLRGIIKLDVVKLKSLSIEDFVQGKTFDVKGFILSEAEVAFMASLGKTHC